MKVVAKSKYSEWTGLIRIREVVALEMKCIYRETSSDDFGIDGMIEVCVPSGKDGQSIFNPKPVRNMLRGIRMRNFQRRSNVEISNTGRRQMYR